MIQGIAIINPVAGASKQQSLLRRMLRNLRQIGFPTDPLLTRGPGDGTVLASRAADAGVDFVIAAGGDGTIREVADGLCGRTPRMLVWPTGTENLFAKSLGFRADPDLIPRCLTQGQTIAVDVGVANRRAFLVVAGVGFDAAVVDRLNFHRKGHITHLTYLEPLWRTFWGYSFPSFRVIHDGDCWWEGRGMAFIGNMSRYSLGLPVVRDARPDDGLLDLLVLPCHSRRQLLAHSLRTLIARHIEHGGARYLRFKKIRIESTVEIPVELDGDCGGSLPLEVHIRPAALHIQLPPEKAAHWPVQAASPDPESLLPIGVTAR